MKFHISHHQYWKVICKDCKSVAIVHDDTRGHIWMREHTCTSNPIVKTYQ